MMKKIWAVLLSICLLVSLATPALAAPIKTSGAASTLKLESVTGTAQLKNASGKDVKVSKGTRLYNGYKLATEKASYAYVNLDDAKAIKLDASSSAEVFQSGKKLELKVNSGQMFFNVSEPLKSDEALTIRTSTMVTGVRGTSGWISVIDRFTTQISLLEGELTITSTDPLTGNQRTITIVAGQTATIVYHGKDKNFESEIIIEDKTIRDLIDDGTISDEHIILTDTGLTVENLQEEDVPGFVAVEVKKDKELQQKIEANSPLSVPDIIGDAQQRLEKDKAAAEAEDKTIQEATENLQADKVDPLFEGSTTTDSVPSGGGSSGGSSSGGSSSGGSSSGGGSSGGDTPSVSPVYYTVTLNEQTYYPSDQTFSDMATSTVLDVAAGTVYELGPVDGHYIYDITVTGTDNWERSNDRVSILIDGDITITITYAPQDEGSGDTGEDTTAYILTIVERILNPDGSYSDPETVTNPGGEIAAGEAYELTAPDGYIIRTPIQGDVSYEITEDLKTAYIYINDNTEITVIYEPTGDAGGEEEDPTVTPTNYTLTVNPITLTYDQTAGNFVESAGDSPTIQNATDPQTITAPVGHVIASVTGEGVEYSLSNDKTSASITMDSNKEITVTYLSTEASLTSPSTAQIDRAMRFYTEYSALYSLPSDSSITLNITGDITVETYTEISIPANYIVNLSGTTTLDNNITLNTAAGTQLNVTNGIFTNNGTISGQGTMTVANGATVDNNSRIEIESTNSLHINAGATLNNYSSIAVGRLTYAGAMQVQGTVNNYNSISLGSESAAGTLTIANSGELNNIKQDGELNGASLSVRSNSIMTVDGTINSAGTIHNYGSVKVNSTGKIIGENTIDTIQNYGELTVDGTVTNKSVSLPGPDNSSYLCDAIYNAGGELYVNASGTVTGGKYGIRSSEVSGGVINIDGGTVSGDIAVSVSGALNLTDGTVSGISCGIENLTASADNIIMDGGIVYVSGENRETTQIISGNITFNGGTLQADIDVFTGSSAEANLQLPQCSYDQTTGKYSIVREDASSRTFTSPASNAELTAALKLDYVKTVNLLAGGELADTTAATVLASGKTLNVKGGTLTVTEGAELAISGKLTVADGAGITCEGILSSVADSTIINHGSILMDNISDPDQFYSETFYANLQNKVVLNGSFANGSTGTLSIGEVDKTDTIDAASKYGYLVMNNTTNDGIISVACNSRLNVQSGTLTNNGTLTLGAHFDSDNIDSYFGKLSITGSNSTLTNNGTVTGGEISLSSGTLVNSASGTFRLEGKNSRLTTGNDVTISNLGSFYVGSQTSATIGYYSTNSPASFSNSGELFLGNEFVSEGSLTNTSSGTIWTGYAAEDDATFSYGYVTLYGTTENQGQIYVSPGSRWQNLGTLYNSGTIDLGADSTDTTSPYYGSTASGNAYMTSNGDNGAFKNGYTSAGPADTGTLNLYSGEFSNGGSFDNGANGQINPREDRTYEGVLENYGTFTNHNEDFSPAGNNMIFYNMTRIGPVSISDNGKYVEAEEIKRDSLYVLVTNSDELDPRVLAYGPIDDVLSSWQHRSAIYQLIPTTGTDGSKITSATMALPDVAAYETLDLNGCTLELTEPVQVGTVTYLDAESEIASSSTYGHLTIADTSSGSTGLLTASLDTDTVVQSLVVLKHGYLVVYGATLQLDEPEDYEGAGTIAPIYVDSCEIPSANGNTTTIAETSVSISGVSDFDGNILAYGKVIGSQCDGIYADGEKTRIYISDGGQVFAAYEGVRILGSDVNLKVGSGEIHADGNGVNISANNVTVTVGLTDANASAEGSLVSGGAVGIMVGGSGLTGVKINVNEGGTVTSTGEAEDFDPYGICAMNSPATIVVDSGTVTAPTTYGSAIYAEGGSTVTVSDDSVVSGYYGISISGSSTLTIEDGAISGTYAIDASDSQINVTGGEIIGEEIGIVYYDTYDPRMAEEYPDYPPTPPENVDITVSGGSVSINNNSIDTQYGIAYYYHYDMYHQITIGSEIFNKENLVNGTYVSVPNIPESGTALVSGDAALIIRTEEV